MLNLLKFEWMKIRSFRRTSIAMLALIFILQLLNKYTFDDTDAIDHLGIGFILIIGLIASLFALLGIGTLMNIKDDLDSTTSINQMIPVSGSKTFIVKMLVFIMNIILIICFAMLFTFIVDLIWNNFSFEHTRLPLANLAKSDLFNLIEQSIYLIYVYSILVYSLLLVKAYTGTTNIVRWMLVFILLYVILTSAINRINSINPWFFDIKNMNIENLGIEHARDLSRFNLFLDIVYFEVHYYSSNNIEIILKAGFYIIPLISTLLVIISSVLLGGRLIDKKIDF